jgi:hypothetical protein
MFNNLFEVSQEEKRRILNLHEEATKKKYLIFEINNTNEDTYGPINFGKNFDYGKYVSQEVKNEINRRKPEIEKFIKDNTKFSKFEVNITAGESRVTNPKGFETPGSLALARSNEVKKYFEEIFSDLIQNGTLTIVSPSSVNDVVIGETPYSKGDQNNSEKKKKYEHEQFVDATIKGIGQKETGPTGSTETLNCGGYFQSSGVQGFGDINKDFYKTLDLEINLNVGEFYISLQTYNMPDILYFSLDGDTNFKNNSGQFRGQDADWTRIFLGTALMAKYGTSLPENLSNQGYSLTKPNNNLLRNTLASNEMRSWKLKSFENVFAGNSPKANEVWMNALISFDNSNGGRKSINTLINNLGPNFPWGYLNGPILPPSVQIGPIKIEQNKSKKLEVINCAPNAKTNWEFQISCK